MRRALALGALLVALLAPPADAATRWGWLGVRIRDLSEQEMEDISKRFGMREGFGAVIVEVIKETPAAAAGLRNGDLVVAFRDRPVVDTRSLQRAIGSTSVGETVRLTVLRPEEGRRPVQVKVGAMPEAMAADRVAAEYGFLVRDPEGQPELGGAAAERGAVGRGGDPAQPGGAGRPAGGRRAHGGRGPPGGEPRRGPRGAARGRGRGAAPAHRPPGPGARSR